MNPLESQFVDELSGGILDFFEEQGFIQLEHLPAQSENQVSFIKDGVKVDVTISDYREAA